MRLRLAHTAELGSGSSVGASLAVAGVCLTVVEARRSGREVELSPETLARTRLGAPAQRRRGQPRAGAARWAIRSAATGCRVTSTAWSRSHARRDDRSTTARFTFELPPAFDAWVVEKGSVTLDGVTLTVAAREPRRFDVALMPHTLAVTTLGAARPGDRLHFEADVLAKYVERAARRARGGGRTARSGPVSWRELAPEPARLWIRFVPKRWPASETAVPRPRRPAHRVGRKETAGAAASGAARRARRPRLRAAGAGNASRRARALGARLRARGRTAPWCTSASDEAAEPTATACRMVDLLELLVRERRSGRGVGAAAEVAVAAPLLPGLFGEEPAWRPWLARPWPSPAGGGGRGSGRARRRSDRRRLAEAARRRALGADLPWPTPAERARVRARRRRRRPLAVLRRARHLRAAAAPQPQSRAVDGARRGGRALAAARPAARRRARHCSPRRATSRRRRSISWRLPARGISAWSAGCRRSRARWSTGGSPRTETPLVDELRAELLAADAVTT